MTEEEEEEEGGMIVLLAWYATCVRVCGVRM